MRLAKVTLSGFKSFADTTEFRFDEPITGIVGPNGCGKSNVVDAIKWVLGERSAKSLRGDAMLDVIFAGSGARKPMGAASVTLTFDNPVVNPTTKDPAERRFLSMDTEQVDVGPAVSTATAAASTSSNGRKCRLRDIKELFMDTGIGTNAYSIIEQGRVDAMLLANPKERRAIFEEAAGVAKFKARKIEAARKLEKAEVNLVRVREQLANTERRLRIVKGQAAKARRFQELDERYRVLRHDLALDQYHELRDRLMGLTSRITDLERSRTAMAEELTAVEDAKQAAEIERHELQGQEREQEQVRLEQVAARRHAEQRREMTQRNLAEAKQHTEEDRQRLEEFGTRLHALEQAIADAESGIADAEREVAETEATVAEAGERQAQRQEAVVEAQDALQKIREHVDTAERERSSRTTARLESIAGRAKGLESSRPD